jgi:hypothetical protein
MIETNDWQDRIDLQQRYIRSARVALFQPAKVFAWS